MAVNTQKLLPAAKTTSALAKANVGKIFSSASIKTKKIDTKKFVGSLAKRDEPGEIVRTLTDIDTRLKLLLGEEKRQQNRKKKEKEKAKFQKAEEKLEAPKESKKFKLPGLAIPGMSFLDRIKRFLFFTALGWLFTKFQDQLPKLVGIVKIITQVYGVAENIFKFLLESFVNLIDRGYKTYDKVRDLAKNIGGEKAQQDFDKLSGKLNEYINYVLVGGMALTGAITGFNKAAGKSTAQAAKGAAGKGILQKTAKVSRIGATKATRAVVGKQATRQLLRLAKGPLSRLPILGGLIEFGLSWALGDPVGKAAFRGVGTILLGAVGSVILPGFGTFIGGLAGAELAGKLYEVLFENKKPTGKVQKKQTGGPVTRGGKTQGAPTRTIRVTRRKPPKVKPQQSQPGKDVGGKKKIRELYPDPSARTDIEGEQKGAWWDGFVPIPKLKENATDAEKKEHQRKIDEKNKKIKSLPNSYKALTGVAKILKDIPFGIGALMGGAVDIALGQKLPRNAIDGLSNGISYLINTLANQQAAKSISGIQKEIATMQTGGITPRLRDFSRTERDEFGSGINKVLSNLIQQKVDEAIREVQKQLMPGKYGESKDAAGGAGGGGGGGAGGAPVPGNVRDTGLKDYKGRPIKLKGTLVDAFIDMAAAYKKETGRNLGPAISSSFRTPEDNQRVGGAIGSLHLTGEAFDINWDSAGGIWIRNNAGKFGFEHNTYSGESTHFEWIGGYTPKSRTQQSSRPGQQPPGKVTSAINGQISFYGTKKDGFGYEKGKMTTASGEKFIPSGMTAAHKTLQFGTKLRVTNPNNGKSVIVTVNDRGPFIGNRVLDLSYGAAKAIDMTGSGVINGKIEVLKKPEDGAIPDAFAGGNKQGGGLISPSKPNRPSLNSYPSYSAEGGTILALQYVYVPQPVPMPSGKNRSIMFPIPVGVNNNNSMQSLSRG